VNSKASAAATNREIVADFEQGKVPGDFHHADHVRVAFAYVAEFPVSEAVARFSSALRRFAAAKGKPNLYHETITWAYLFLIAERVARSGGTQSWGQFSRENPDLFVWKGSALNRYYSQGTLDSDYAKKNFVLPDLGVSSGS